MPTWAMGLSGRGREYFLLNWPDLPIAEIADEQGMTGPFSICRTIGRFFDTCS